MRELYYGDHQITKRYLGDRLVYEWELFPKELSSLTVSANNYSLERWEDTYCFYIKSSDPLLKERSYVSHLQFLDQTLQGPLILKSLDDQTWSLLPHTSQDSAQALQVLDAMCNYFPGTDQRVLEDGRAEYTFSEMISMTLYL